MTTLTSGQASKINKSNRACQDASLGTNVKTAQEDIATLQGLVKVSGSVLVTTAMMSASRVPIINATATHGYVWKYIRSGSPVSTIKELIWTPASGCLILSNYNLSTGSMLPSDEVYYFGW